MSYALQQLHEEAALALERLRKRFADPVSITLIVRNHVDPSGERDFILTDDTLDGIDTAIAAARARERMRT